MASRAKDPTEPIRLEASRYPEVDAGTACTQSSFKANKKAFLYIGPQGGRFKAMFRLKHSTSEVAKLARKHPDRFDVGKAGWATARFSADQPLPRRLWKKWLDESYALTQGGLPSRKRTASKKAAPPSAPGKQAAGTKKTAKKKTGKKKTGKKRAVARKKRDPRGRAASRSR